MVVFYFLPDVSSLGSGCFYCVLWPKDGQWPKQAGARRFVFVLLLFVFFFGNIFCMPHQVALNGWFGLVVWGVEPLVLVGKNHQLEGI